MKTEVSFDEERKLLVFRVSPDGAVERALLNLLQKQKPKIEWVDRGQGTYWQYDLEFTVALVPPKLK